MNSRLFAWLVQPMLVGFAIRDAYEHQLWATVLMATVWWLFWWVVYPPVREKEQLP